MTGSREATLLLRAEGTGAFVQSLVQGTCYYPALIGQWQCLADCLGRLIG